MTLEHKEFLEFFKALKFVSEEDRALACWTEARRVALLDAAEAPPASGEPKDTRIVRTPAGEREALIAKLQEDAIEHREVSYDCDCDPTKTLNHQHYLHCIAAADMLEADAKEIERLNAGWHKANCDTLDKALESDALKAAAKLALDRLNGSQPGEYAYSDSMLEARDALENVLR